MTRTSTRRALPALAAAIAALVAFPVAAAHAAARQTPYSLQGGCFDLRVGETTTPAIRMQATTLGRYLLYTRDGRFVATAGGTAAQPGPDGEWIVTDESGRLTIAPRNEPARALEARFTPTSGCAVFPEAELDATGPTFKGKLPYGEVRGILDGHMHWTTYQYFGGRFHCGAPWSAYGITKALPDCESIEGAQGISAPFQNFLNFGVPEYPHSTAGWPTFTSWSRDNLTYEGTYWRWVQRQYMAGLRLMVMGVNENRVLCLLQTNRTESCDEMQTVRRGIAAMHEMQDYVDAQAGGPGKGFFQIVTDPLQARKVINAGKMAVVLEIEVSEPFGCRDFVNPACNSTQIDRSLDEFYKLGVRSSLLIAKFDNALGGVRFDSGPVGVVLNAGNRLSGGAFWSAQTCTAPETDNPITPSIGAPADLLATLGVAPGTLPVYPPAPHCNTRGLTSLGRHAVRAMMDRGMIVNPDHMSQRSVDDTLTIAEGRRYSGVISPHSWMDPRNWPRLWALGGIAFPFAGKASSFVQIWQQYRPKQTPFYFGWGYGADLGGLAHQGAPVAGDSPAKVTYPFKSWDGKVTFERQKTGTRTFDYSKEGVSHYGLYADWMEEVRKLGGPRIVEDMLRGPEAYLQMWERSTGIRPSSCRPARGVVTARGLGTIRVGLRPDDLLRSAGQPLRRNRAWTYCAGGRGSHAIAAVFTPEQRVGLVASTALQHAAAGVRPGDRTRALRAAGARPVGGGVWRGPAGKRRTAYRVRNGRVDAVGISLGTLTRKELRAEFKLVPNTVVRPVAKVRSSLGAVSDADASPLALREAGASAANDLLAFCRLLA